MLKDFLNEQLLIRRGKDLFFDLTDWAKEIGIDYSALRKMLINDNPDPRITNTNLAKLVAFFGPPVLEAVGVRVPAIPSNPLAAKIDPEDLKNQKLLADIKSVIYSIPEQDREKVRSAIRDAAGKYKTAKK
jgi:hypothetical protein